MLIMYNRSQFEFQISDYRANVTALGEETMLAYDKTFNIIFGTGNKSLNWLDNPYIEPNVYDITNQWIPKKSENIKLRKCDPVEDLEKFMKPNVALYYPNSLCISDKETVSFLSNWFDEKYSNIWISLDAC